MNLCVGLTLLVLFAVDRSFAKESCITCRGSDCLKQDILQLECSKFVPALPFESQLLIGNNVGNLEYGCLDLKYYIGETLQHLQQCIQTSKLPLFCETLEYSLKVKECSVTSSGDGTGNVESLNDAEESLDELQAYMGKLETEPELEEGSGDTSDIPDPDGSTTPQSGSSAMHLISLSSLLGVVLITLL